MILITRPQLEAEELKAKLLDRKINAHCDSLISFRHNDVWTDNESMMDINSVCLFTSIQAVLSIEKKYSLNDYLKDVRIVCVGERVSNYLKSKSVGNIINIFRDSDQLIAELDFNNFKKNPLIYFCGNNYNTDLVDQIKSVNIKCEPIVVYSVNTAEELSMETQVMIKKNQIQSVALYSQFSANVFMDLLQKANLLDPFRERKIFCLSKNIAMKVKSSGFNNIIIPASSNEVSMINVIKKSLLV
jgi:uroporphyrinogen-III synthase